MKRIDDYLNGMVVRGDKPRGLHWSVTWAYVGANRLGDRTTFSGLSRCFRNVRNNFPQFGCADCLDAFETFVIILSRTWSSGIY